MQSLSVLSPGLDNDAKIVLSGFPGLIIRQNGTLDLCQDTLAREMLRLVDNGVALLVGLVEDEELGCVVYEDVIDAAQRVRIETTRFPLPDFSVPLPAREDDWQRVLFSATYMLRQGSSVALHCLAGDGRSGLLAACLLVDLGFSSQNALREVRAIRPGAIETDTQLDYLFSRSGA